MRGLVWLAAELPDEAITAIITDELPGLTTLGLFGEQEPQELIGFVSFDASREPVEIEYIAVGAAAQHGGHGSRLIEAVRDHVGGATLYAQTDDDAVDFYRKRGFTITSAAPDPRWPERQRYDCALTSA